MARAIFVNLCVADLQRARRFFERLGYAFDERFSDEQAAALVISDTIYAMLLTPDSFRRFTSKPIVDARNATEVLLALQFGSREEVDGVMERALSSGGREAREAEDHGFMYHRAFEDPDGHIWEAFWMDTGQFPAANAGSGGAQPD